MDSPILPIPISYVSGRYLLFSIDAVTYLRREHHICGVLVGTLPQIPQQNVFLGSKPLVGYTCISAHIAAIALLQASTAPAAQGSAFTT